MQATRRDASNSSSISKDTNKSMDANKRRDASKSRDAFAAETFGEKTRKPTLACMEANDSRDVMDASKNMHDFRLEKIHT
jgi:hypothetical protein